MKSYANKPRNRENRTKRSRTDGMISVSFPLPQEDWVRIQKLMRQRDLTASQIFYAGLDAITAG